MTNPLKTNASASLGLLLARLPVGAFFVLAGYEKVFKTGVDSFVKIATTTARPLPFEVSPGVMNAYLHAVPFLELVVGTWLIVGIFSRISALIGGLMLVSFVVGCTGIMMTGMPFHPNVIYLGVLLCVLLAGAGTMSLDQLLFNKKKRKPQAA
jgi:uncharacterized membrane protein YphA (DoxX/SURF4 family)